MTTKSIDYTCWGKSELINEISKLKSQIAQSKKDFPIISVCRSDAESIGFYVSTLTDKDFEEIAERLAESYMEGNGNFWQDLENILIEVYKLPQHDI